jgi:hypothetical protein
MVVFLAGHGVLGRQGRAPSHASAQFVVASDFQIGQRAVLLDAIQQRAAVAARLGLDVEPTADGLELFVGGLARDVLLRLLEAIEDIKERPHP